MGKGEKVARPYKLLLQKNGQEERGRSKEEVELMWELLMENRIFAFLGLTQNSIREICQKMVLIWVDHPHIIETGSHEVYFVLEGKAFEYMQSKDPGLKACPKAEDDYIMMRQLAHNDFFLASVPDGHVHGATPKYQMMVDQDSLVGKVEGEVYARFFLPLVEDRASKVSGFLRQVEMFSSLPPTLIHQLSRYLNQVPVPAGSSIFTRQERNPYLYFIQSGQVELRTYSLSEGRPSLTPNKHSRADYPKPQGRVVLKENDLFGLDSFDAETIEKKESEYSAQSITPCLLYTIEKRILAIVISFFEEVFRCESKLINCVNLNDQIQGQGYQTDLEAQLCKKAALIKTSEKKMRDVRLRCLETSGRRKAGQGTTPFEEALPTQDQNDALLDIKNQSCHGFAALTVNKERLKNFYQTVNPRRDDFIIEQPHPHRLNNIVLSAFTEETEADKQQPVAVQRRTSFNIKRKSEGRSGKEEADIMRAFMEKKNNKEMMRKTQTVLLRKSSSAAKKGAMVKRLFSLKARRHKSDHKPGAGRKEVGDQLFQKMTKIDQYPLVNLVEGERKKLESRAKRILEIKLKEAVRPGKPSKSSRGPILPANN